MRARTKICLHYVFRWFASFSARFSFCRCRIFPPIPTIHLKKYFFWHLTYKNHELYYTIIWNIYQRKKFTFIATIGMRHWFISSINLTLILIQDFVSLRWIVEYLQIITDTDDKPDISQNMLCIHIHILNLIPLLTCISRSRSCFLLRISISRFCCSGVISAKMKENTHALKISFHNDV